MANVKRAKFETALVGRALNLAGLVQVQPGAIVSREVLRKRTGTVTVFAFDDGQELSEHTAPFDALVLGIEGAADITLSGRVHRLAAGEMIIMPARQPHALKAAGRFKMALVMIRS
jgi:quercetin dioxygenase-like cupin family protein